MLLGESLWQSWRRGVLGSLNEARQVGNPRQGRKVVQDEDCGPCMGTAGFLV